MGSFCPKCRHTKTAKCANSTGGTIPRRPFAGIEGGPNGRYRHPPGHVLKQVKSASCKRPTRSLPQAAMRFWPVGCPWRRYRMRPAGQRHEHQKRSAVIALRLGDRPALFRASTQATRQRVLRLLSAVDDDEQNTSASVQGAAK